MIKIIFVVCLLLAGCSSSSVPAGNAHYCESGWGLINEDSSVRKGKSYVVCTKQINNASVFRKGSTEVQWLTRAN